MVKGKIKRGKMNKKSKRKLKRKIKKRPPRLFTKKGKLYVRVGGKKYLILFIFIIIYSDLIFVLNDDFLCNFIK